MHGHSTLLKETTVSFITVHSAKLFVLERVRVAAVVDFAQVSMPWVSMGSTLHSWQNPSSTARSLALKAGEAIGALENARGTMQNVLVTKSASCADSTTITWVQKRAKSGSPDFNVVADFIMTFYILDNLLLSLGKCIILALKIINGHKCSSFKHSPCTELDFLSTNLIWA